MHWSISSILTLCLTLNPLFAEAKKSPQEPAGAPYQAVVDGLPRSPAGGPAHEIGIKLLGGVFFEDLNALHKQRQNAITGELNVVAKGLAAGLGQQLLGVDFDTQLLRLATIAAPYGQAAPAALIAFETAQSPVNFQIMLQVQPGAAERLQAAPNTSSEDARSTAPTSSWTAEKGDGEFFWFQWGDMRWPGRIDEAGWLRIAPAKEMLLGREAGGRAPAVFEANLRQQLVGTDGVFWVRGADWLSGPLAALGGEWQALMQQVRTLALGFSLSNDSTSEFRVLGDAPILATFAPMIRQSGLGAELIKMWGSQLTGAFSLSLPGPVLASGLALLQQNLLGSPLALPESFMANLGQLKGTVNIVSFSAPADWAVGLEFVAEDAAAAVVPGLQEWFVQLVSAFNLGELDMWSLQEQADVPTVLHVRADPLLEGVRVAALGNNVVLVRQKARYQALRQRFMAELGPQAGTVGGPLTKRMRHLVEQPAILTAYTVYADDGSMIDWLVWPAKALEIFVAGLGELPNDFPPMLQDGLASVLSRLPLRLAALAAESMLIYDVGLSIDLLGDVFVLRFATSDI